MKKETNLRGSLDDLRNLFQIWRTADDMTLFVLKKYDLYNGRIISQPDQLPKTADYFEWASNEERYSESDINHANE